MARGTIDVKWARHKNCETLLSRGRLFPLSTFFFGKIALKIAFETTSFQIFGYKTQNTLYTLRSYIVEVRF